MIYQPKRTLSFKLLIGATLIVLVLMGASFGLALNYLTKETSAFTFEIQSNQTQLVGQRFSNLIDSVLNTLKILPELNEATKAALDQQSNIKNLEVFDLKNEKAFPKRVFAWGPMKGSLPPKPSLIKEILKTGVTYLAMTGRDNQSDIHLFYLQENDNPEHPWSIIRAKLNLDEIIRKSQGVHSQVLSREGMILLDTRSAVKTGSKLESNHPLLKAAMSSVVSLGTLEYKDPKTKSTYLGTYLLPGYNVMILSSVKFVDAMRGTYLLLEKILLMGLALLGASLIIVVIFSIKLTRPLTQLTEATQVLGSGNFDLALNENYNDEIGVLSRSMNTMSKKIKELLLESIEKVKIEQEVAIASTLQQNLIPPPVIETDRYQIFSHYQSAKECGGDWWGYIETKDELTLLISDATGHGLPPAMLTAAAHGCFVAMQKVVTDFPELVVTPSTLLNIANRVISESAKNEINMTMFIASYRFKTGELVFANAGHNLPWLIKRGDTSEGKIEILKARGQRLGEKGEFEPFVDHHMKLNPDDSLFFFTDGLIENPDLNGSEYGKMRARETLLTRYSDGPSGMASALNGDIETFYKGFIPNDDVTFVLFKPKTSGASANA